MDFDDYDLDPSFYDEMFLPDGSPREHWRHVYEILTRISAERLASIQDRVTRSFSNEGITFAVYGDEEAQERTLPVDCVPRVLSSAEWRHLEAGLTQRLKALNLFLEDIYGRPSTSGPYREPRIVHDGVIPVDMIRGCPQYRIEMRGFSAPQGAWVAICGTDLRAHQRRIHGSGGQPTRPLRRVVHAGEPEGSQVEPAPPLSKVPRPGNINGGLLQETLRELAPKGQSDPCIALLTPGVYNSAFYEHIFLARELGAELVEGRDLLVNDGFVLQRVDVIYRRVEDDFLDPLVFRPDSLLGVPGLIHAYKLGNVTLANAPGTGVADDKSVYAYVPDMVRYYLSEEPILANVDTRLCRRPEDLEYTLDNLQDLVVKRVGESGGYGTLVGPHSTPEERAAYAEQLRADPADFISQPVLDLSRAPCLIEGRFEPRHVDLRPFVLQGRETRIVPGAFCRVALRRGSLVVNSSQGGGGKDLWVLED